MKSSEMKTVQKHSPNQFPCWITSSKVTSGANVPFERQKVRYPLSTCGHYADHRRIEELSSALESAASPLAISTTVRQLTFERLERELAELSLVSQRRSGARGLKARQAVTAKEDEVKEAQLA